MQNDNYRPRLIDQKLDFYLSTFGAVCVEGPKWCGKTWTSLFHAKSAFMVGDPADNFANRQLAFLEIRPGSFRLQTYVPGEISAFGMWDVRRLTDLFRLSCAAAGRGRWAKVTRRR